MRVLLSSLFLLLLSGPGWAAPDYSAYAPQFAAMGYTLGSTGGTSTGYEGPTGRWQDATGSGAGSDQQGQASIFPSSLGEMNAACEPLLA